MSSISQGQATIICFTPISGTAVLRAKPELGESLSYCTLICTNFNPIHHRWPFKVISGHCQEWITCRMYIFSAGHWATRTIFLSNIPILLFDAKLLGRIHKLNHSKARWIRSRMHYLSYAYRWKRHSSGNGRQWTLFHMMLRLPTPRCIKLWLRPSSWRYYWLPFLCPAMAAPSVALPTVVNDILAWAPVGVYIYMYMHTQPPYCRFHHKISGF